MMNQRPIRASDQDRERTAEFLSDAYAVGCLDKDELEQRSALAYSARTLGELQDLVADLPAWLLDRPLPLPHEFCGEYPPRRRTLPRSAALLVALVGLWIIVVTAAWMPLLAVPLTVIGLLLTIIARNRP